MHDCETFHDESYREWSVVSPHKLRRDILQIVRPVGTNATCPPVSKIVRSKQNLPPPSKLTVFGAHVLQICDGVRDRRRCRTGHALHLPEVERE